MINSRQRKQVFGSAKDLSWFLRAFFRLSFGFYEPQLETWVTFKTKDYFEIQDLWKYWSVQVLRCGERNTVASSCRNCVLLKS